MSNELRIGLIGASARGGWARESHIPAIQGTDGVVLEAVATSHQASADEAARAFQARLAFGDAHAMVQAPSVDLVVVSVAVPAHRELVIAALEAGKHVLSEWPLGTNVDDAALMAAAASRAGKHAAIGLQARFSPSVQKARELIDSGRIGRILSARVLSTTIALGPAVGPDAVYMEDPATGVTVYTIHGGHTFDLVEALLGTVTGARVQLSTLYPEVTLPDGTQAKRQVPEHALFTGRLKGGAPFSIEVAGAREAAWPFELEVIGSAGKLVLRGGGPRGFQTTSLGLFVNGLAIAMRAHALSEAAVNVAGLYAALRDDIARGTHEVPGFAHALALTEALDSMARGLTAEYHPS